MASETEQDAAALRAEIERQQTELQRLRELLLTRDEELGEALGRMAVVEHRASRIHRVIDLVRAHAPGFVRRGARLMRGLRRRG
jgi:hypothetical protein